MTDDQTKTPLNFEVLVVGAGITGLRAALDLAETGHEVLLIDRAPSAAGLLNLLDHQFPNDHCGMCRLLPMVNRDQVGETCLRRGLIHERIHFMPQTELVSLEGLPGRLTAELSVRPAGVDPELCTACGRCLAACPVEVPLEDVDGLFFRKPVHLAGPHLAASPPVIDFSACTKCGECVRVCPTGAVNLEAAPESFMLENLGAVVAATGARLYDPGRTDVYGYGQYPRVVSAAGFEQMIRFSPPGRLVHPGGGRDVEKIAWVQCVGSRNVMIGAPHCSSACCMYALKEARLALDRTGGSARPVIFYMDLRTFGRDFQRYRDESEAAGVSLVRCRVHSVDPLDDPDQVRVRYVDPAGKLQARDFDLVVLSTGRDPSAARLDWFDHEGVVVADSVPVLVDIADAVASGSDAAARAAEMLDNQDKAAAPAAHVPAMAGVDDLPRLLLARIQGPWDSLLDWEQMSWELTRVFPGLMTAEIPAGPADRAWEAVRKELTRNRANRLILAVGRPTAYGRLMLNAEKSLGLDRSLIQLVDLGAALMDGVSAERFSASILDGVKMAAARLDSREPAQPQSLGVSPSVLVVGGGPAGLAAALTLAAQKAKVILVEKNGALGGNLDSIKTLEARIEVQRLITEVSGHNRVEVLLNSQATGVRGGPGAYLVAVDLADGSRRSVSCGAVILAPGGAASRPEAYSWGQSPNIVYTADLEEKIEAAGTPDSLNVVMIQCAGSREEPRNYCSRVCCVGALESALRIKEKNPTARITVLHRDIMTYGASEQIYTRTRQAGVMFIPFDLEGRPRVTVEEGGAAVRIFDPVLQEETTLRPDWLALSAGLEPAGGPGLARLFGLELTRDGFVREADAKWRPFETGREGVFICGLARGPVRALEAVREGRAAGVRALALLHAGRISSARVTSRVRRAICSLCQTCIDVCPYGARSLDESGIFVDPAACQGCGLCAAACPNSAAVVSDYEEIGLMNALEAVL